MKMNLENFSTWFRDTEEGISPTTSKQDENDDRIRLVTIETRSSFEKVEVKPLFPIFMEDPSASSGCSSSDSVGKKSSIILESGSRSDSIIEDLEGGGSKRKHLAPDEKHFQMFAHHRKWTLLGLFSTWMGFLFSYLARDSTEFVNLELPIYIDPVYEKVYYVGMINLKLCYDETSIERAQCFLERLDSNEIDDSMFEASRSFAFLACLLGGFASVMLTTSVVWYSINLRPIGLIFLLCYFFQSFSFLFFDTKLCDKYGCNISTGGYYAVAASIFWIVACISASRMDAVKYREVEEKMECRKDALEKSLSTPETTRSSSTDDSDRWDLSSSSSSSSNPSGIKQRQDASLGVSSPFPTDVDSDNDTLGGKAVDTEDNWLRRQVGDDLPSKQRKKASDVEKKKKTKKAKKSSKDESTATRKSSKRRQKTKGGSKVKSKKKQGNRKVKN